MTIELRLNLVGTTIQLKVSLIPNVNNRNSKNKVESLLFGKDEQLSVSRETSNQRDQKVGCALW